MEDSEKNLILGNIIENSSFTQRQIQIIYKIINKEKKPRDISAGAYYREIKQCKEKIRRIYYSFIILNLIGILDNERITALNSIAQMIYKLQEISEVNHKRSIDNVIDIINQIVNKISP
ncbi:MAG: hypothetical protein ACTHJ7_06945 [Candidatus Nitrosocosmicus sp.]